MTPKTITEDELADALARRDGMSREDAGRVARTLLADVEARRERPPVAADPVRAAVLDGMLITSLGERADRAEEKLAAIERLCGHSAVSAWGGATPIVAADSILAIIGGTSDYGQENCRG